MYDVIVVGAGPAGSTAARMCAKAGLSVLLLEKDAIPRYKFCGGGLTHAAYKELDFSVDGVVRQRVRKALLMRKGRRLELSAPEPICHMVMRDEFDALLAEKAAESGAELRDGQRVRDVRILKERVEVVSSQVTYKGRCVIGADGYPSVVAQKVAEPLRKEDLGIAVGDEVNDGDVPEHLEILYGSLPFSYGWAFPKGDGISFGYGAYLKHSNGIKNELIQYMKERGCAPKRIYGHLIPMWRRWRKVHGERALLCGDAAGFADPFQGEGMRYAIMSGKIAAEVVKEACEKDDFSERFLLKYGRECGRRFAEDLIWADRVSRLFYRNVDLFFSIAEEERDLANAFLGTLRGTLSYKDFIKMAIPKMPGALLGLLKRPQ